MRVDQALDQAVRSRADDLCKYCLLPQQASDLRFPLDHIVARQHGGLTRFENLALCCGRCNRSKGPNIAGIDPVTGQMTRLFNPRTDTWNEHFRYDGPVLVGLTAVGRTTIVVLAMNNSWSVQVRRALLETGSFPPQPRPPV